MPACVANLVASEKFEAQSSDLSFDLFTPEADGLFRLSLYNEMDSSGTTTASFTDGKGEQSIVAGSLPSGGSNDRKEFNVVFHAIASNPIHISTAMDTFPFSLYVTLEQLQ